MEAITVETVVQAPMQKVWRLFNEPEHIVQWGSASDDWHTTKAQNDVRVGGTYAYRMESIDGSQGFDLSAAYDEVEPQSLLAYTMGDGRKVRINFKEEGSAVRITESFEPEAVNSADMQRDGWQAILHNFKRYVESH